MYSGFWNLRFNTTFWIGGYQANSSLFRRVNLNHCFTHTSIVKIKVILTSDMSSNRNIHLVNFTTAIAPNSFARQHLEVFTLLACLNSANNIENLTQ